MYKCTHTHTPHTHTYINIPIQIYKCTYTHKHRVRRHYLCDMKLPDKCYFAISTS